MIELNTLIFFLVAISTTGLSCIMGMLWITTDNKDNKETALIFTILLGIIAIVFWVLWLMRIGVVVQ